MLRSGLFIALVVLAVACVANADGDKKKKEPNGSSGGGPRGGGPRGGRPGKDGHPGSTCRPDEHMRDADGEHGKRVTPEHGGRDGPDHAEGPQGQHHPSSTMEPRHNKHHKMKKMLIIGGCIAGTSVLLVSVITFIVVRYCKRSAVKARASVYQTKPAVSGLPQAYLPPSFPCTDLPVKKGDIDMEYGETSNSPLDPGPVQPVGVLAGLPSYSSINVREEVVMSAVAPVST